MTNYIITDTTLVGLADNIRRIKNLTAKMSATDMVDYLNSITVRTASNLSASGATVTVPAGYYNSQVTKSVATAAQATPSITVNPAGLVTVSATQAAGYVAAGTKTATKQLSTQAAKTVTPTLSEQTAVAANVYTTGVVKVAAMPTATQATPSVIINSSGLITASATQTEGYVAAGTKSSTKQLTTQAAKTVTPSTSEQTAVAANRYTTGAVTVAAIPSNYKDTSDANATAVDIVSSKTAYVNGSKITGTNPYVKSTTDTAVNTQASLISEASTILASKVAGSGNSADTSDATALPTDLAEGKTAYAKGVKITGTIPETDWFEEYADGVSQSGSRIVLEGLQHAAAGPQRQIVNYGARLDIAASEFGNAAAADVMRGKTFTSSSGLKVTGTGALLETEPYPAYEFVLTYNDREAYGWGFTKSTTSGYTDYYESENKGDDAAGSASYCDCYFNVWTPCTVTFSVMNSGEGNFDYGVVGPLDGNISSDNSNASYTFKGVLHSSPVNITFENVGVGQHRVQFKYQKDGSVNNNSDCFRFKLVTAPNTAAVLTAASKELVRSYEHEIDPYNIRQGAEILGVAGTFDNSAKNCSITVQNCEGRAYWTKANWGSLIYQMMVEDDTNYTMSNVACNSTFVIYSPYCWFNSAGWDYSSEIALIAAQDNWAVFAAPATANYSGYVSWTGGNG